MNTDLLRRDNLRVGKPGELAVKRDGRVATPANHSGPRHVVVPDPQEKAACGGVDGVDLYYSKTCDREPFNVEDGKDEEGRRSDETHYQNGGFGPLPHRTVGRVGPEINLPMRTAHSRQGAPCND